MTFSGLLGTQSSKLASFELAHEFKTLAIFVDADLKGSPKITTQADADLAKLGVTKTHLVDSFLLKRIPKTFNVDIILKQSRIVTAKVDVDLKQTKTIKELVDSVFKKSSNKTFSVDALKLFRHTVTNNVDATFKKGSLVTASVDTVLKGKQTRFMLVDGSFCRLIKITHSVDAKLSLAYFVDSLFRKTVKPTFTVDSLLPRRTTKTHSVDVAPFHKTLTVQVDSFIKRGQSMITVVDAYIIPTVNVIATIQITTRNDN